MKSFLFSASALVLLSSAAMAEPAPLSDGQLGAVAAGNSAAWSLIATNIVNNTLANTTTTTTTLNQSSTVGQSLTGGSSNNVYNVALSSNGAFATGYATTAVTGMIVGAP